MTSDKCIVNFIEDILTWINKQIRKQTKSYQI